MALVVGNKAPDFKLQADNEQQVSLADFKGQRFILYFYPKDNTPGCTTQACDFRDEFVHFKKLKIPVLGVSRDSVTSHQKFKSKFELPFVLLSDSEGKMCEAYGVLVEKNMYGCKYIGVERSTFLINAEGKIEAMWRKVKVSGHVAEVLESIK